ncbi:MAG: hypothetical protein RLZZ196_1176 [Bacteroidota bacterium]|jgi:hypothetical protein
MENEKLEPIGEVLLTQKRLEECEWCYQFDDDEPKIFAWTDDEMDKQEDPAVTFTVSNTENAYISFSHNGKTFKLFARELTDAGKALREYQKKSAEELKKDIENASKNKEA